MNTLKQSSFQCELKDENCSGRIELHHNLIYAYRQVDRAFCIIKLCKKHHSMADRKDIKEKLDYIMIKKMTADDFKDFPRVNWSQKFKYLKSKSTTKQI